MSLRCIDNLTLRFSVAKNYDKVLLQSINTKGDKFAAFTSAFYLTRVNAPDTLNLLLVFLSRYSGGQHRNRKGLSRG